MSYDFAQLALFADDKLEPRTLHDDPIPNPQYFHVENTSVIDTFRLLSPSKIYSDSEGYPHRPWSVQWAAHAGTGYLVKAENVAVLDDGARLRTRLVAAADGMNSPLRRAETFWELNFPAASNDVFAWAMT